MSEREKIRPRDNLRNAGLRGRLMNRGALLLSVALAASACVDAHVPTIAPTTPPASITHTGWESSHHPSTDPCVVTSVDPSLGLDPYYQKMCWAGGIPIVASASVNNRAFETAAGIVNGMLDPLPEVRDRLQKQHLRVGIIGINEKATDLPEYNSLPKKLPNFDFTTARSYGAHPYRPLMVGPEENLSRVGYDTYRDECPLVHEMGHTVLDMVVIPNDPTFFPRVEGLYKKFKNTPERESTYSAIDPQEFWADGTQEYFNASRWSFAGDPDIRNSNGPIATREDLRKIEPEFYELLHEIWGDNPWQPEAAPECIAH